MKTGTAFSKVSSIIDSKIWGCLADATTNADRYDRYANGKYLKFSLREYWKEVDIERFIDKLKLVFNQDIVIMRKDTIDDVARRIKKAVGNNLSKL